MFTMMDRIDNENIGHKMFLTSTRICDYFIFSITNIICLCFLSYFVMIINVKMYCNKLL